MKNMLLLAFLVIVGFVFLAEAQTKQDLGALAKKEKARREALARQGKKGKTFTKEDIQNLKAELGIQQSSSEEGEATEPDDSGTTGTSTETSDTTTAETEATEQATEQPAAEEQRPLFPGEEPAALSAEEQLKNLRLEREELEQQVAEARKAVDQGGLLHSRNVGDQYDKASAAEQRLKELDKEIRETEQRIESEKQKQ